MHSWFFDLMGDPWSLLKSLDCVISVIFTVSFDPGFFTGVLRLLLLFALLGGGEVMQAHELFQDR